MESIYTLLVLFALQKATECMSLAASQQESCSAQNQYVVNTKCQWAIGLSVRNRLAFLFL